MYKHGTASGVAQRRPRQAVEAPVVAQPSQPHVKPELPWRERAFQTLQQASQITGVSVASVYRFAAEGRISFRRLAGRTLVDTASLIKLIDSAESWTPSSVGSAARAARASLAQTVRAA